MPARNTYALLNAVVCHFSAIVSHLTSLCSDGVQAEGKYGSIELTPEIMPTWDNDTSEGKSGDDDA